MKKDVLKEIAHDSSEKHKTHFYVSADKRIKPISTKDKIVRPTSSKEKRIKPVLSKDKIEKAVETGNKPLDSKGQLQTAASAVKSKTEKYVISNRSLPVEVSKSEIKNQVKARPEYKSYRKIDSSETKKISQERLASTTRSEGHLNEKKEEKKETKSKLSEKKAPPISDKKSDKVATQRKSNRFADQAKAYMSSKAVRVAGLEDTELDDIKQVASSTRSSVRMVKKAGKKGARTAVNVAKSPWWIKDKTVAITQRIKQIVAAIKLFIVNPVVFIQSMGIGTIIGIVVALVAVIVVTIMSIFPSVSLKNDELELSRTWEHISHLDANVTQKLQTSKKSDLTLNDSFATREDVSIYTNLDSVLYYFDGMYGNYKLDALKAKPTYFKGRSMMEEIDNFYQGIVSVKESSDGEDVLITEPAEYLQKNKKVSKEIQSQLESLDEVGQYMTLQELASPFPSETTLNVSKRYGYHVENKRVTNFKGIVIEADTGKNVYSPLSGDVTISGNTVTIKSKKKTVTLTAVTPSIKNRSAIKKGALIGKTSTDKGITVTYKKGWHDVNPGFYLPGIQYMQSTNFGFQSSGDGFDEAMFRQLISTKCGAFRMKADKIIAEAKKAGVSPVIFAAIMIHESAWGNSSAILTHNNPSGQMTSSGLIHYSSLDQGIEATGRTLHNLIVERKLQTVEALGSVYCPVGAANDPTGLNKNWVPAIKSFMTQLGGSGTMSLLWSEGSASGRAGQMLKYANDLYQKGVIYSQGGGRGTFPYHDCSSFVTLAMKSAGVAIGIGSTETLYSVEGTLLQPISRSQVRPGDIFVWGTKGASGGNYGHTGIFLDNGGKNIIHCTPSVNQKGNIVKTPFEGYYGSPDLAPVYFYRVK